MTWLLVTTSGDDNMVVDDNKWQPTAHDDMAVGDNKWYPTAHDDMAVGDKQQPPVCDNMAVDDDDMAGVGCYHHDADISVKQSTPKTVYMNNTIMLHH